MDCDWVQPSICKAASYFSDVIYSYSLCSFFVRTVLLIGNMELMNL
jgi:hypothetical protein